MKRALLILTACALLQTAAAPATAHVPLRCGGIVEGPLENTVAYKRGIVDEVNKAMNEGRALPHSKLTDLFSRYVEADGTFALSLESLLRCIESE